MNSMMNVMEKVIMERVRLILSETSGRYGFDCEEEMLRIGCVSGKKVSKSVTKKVVILYSYPYVGVEMASCLSVKHNSGLYSQCLNEREAGSDMCVGCVSRANKRGGVPEYGYIKDRGSDLEFSSKYGRAVMSYGKLVNKNKWDMRAVMEEGGKYNILLTEEMFNMPVKVVKEKMEKEKGRGRPKKESKVVESEDETQDLFRVLQGELRQESMSMPSQEAVNKINEIKDMVEKSRTVSNDVELKSSDESSMSSGSSSTKAEKKALKDAAKLEKEAAKVVEKASKLEKEEVDKASKLEKESSKAAEKMEKEEADKVSKLEKEAAKAAEKLEKEAAKAAEKLEKEAAKEVDKAAKELEKMAKAAEKLEKETTKALEKKAKLEKEAAKAADKLAKLEKASVKSVVVVVEKKVEIVVEKADSGYVSASSELSCETNTDDDSEDEVKDKVEEEEEEEEEEEDHKLVQELVEVVAPVIVNVHKTVRRFRHNDIDYLMSPNDNIMYLASTKEPVGKWNEATNSMDELDDVESDSDAESDSDEEEEEESDDE